MNFDGKRISGFFAPESLVTPDGRRVMWAWLVGGGNTLWEGIQSLPRELSLPEDGVLRIKPLRELERLRHSPRSRTDLTVKSGQTRVLEDMAGDTLELRLTATPGTATSYGVRVYTDSEGGHGLPIRVDPLRKVLQVGVEEAPFELRPGEDLNLTVYLDRRIVEVFVNGRQAMAQHTEYKTTDLGISLFSEGGDLRISQLDAWEMAPTNPW